MTEQLTDRELDAWLEEHLFGGRRGEAFGVEMVRWPENAEARYSLIPTYSATGGGMLLVLEAMRELRWGCEVIARPSGWSAEFSRYPRWGLSWADALPRAVAEAAKDALEAEQ